MGDGNINFVYIVEGPQGGLVVKQGLPYIRIAPDWPLTQVSSPVVDAPACRPRSQAAWRACWLYFRPDGRSQKCSDQGMTDRARRRLPVRQPLES